MNGYSIPIDVPEGQRGKWRIDHFTVSEEESKLHRMLNAFTGSLRYCPPGTYERLWHDDIGVVMSNTPDECRDHRPIIKQATGKVLINGLGLGVVLEAIKDKVEHVTVVEIDYDVIALVAPHYQLKYGERLRVIHDDALTYKPPRGERFDAVWHDIWYEIADTNLDQMKVLHRRYGRLTKWQGSWCRDLCEAQRRESQRWDYY
jgi:hypothetical protein